MSNIAIPPQVSASLNRIRQEGTLGPGATRVEIPQDQVMGDFFVAQSMFTGVAAQDQTPLDSDKRPGFIQLPADQFGVALTAEFTGPASQPTQVITKMSAEGENAEVVTVAETSQKDDVLTHTYTQAITADGYSAIGFTRFEFGPGYTNAKGYTESLESK